MAWCMGAWLGDVVLWGWEKCSGILPELVRLDFGIGGGLVLGGDGDSAEGFGVVSGCETEKIYLFMSCALKLRFRFQ